MSRGEVVPYLQPIVDIGSGALRGAEALARWEHPDRGVITPDQFLGLVREGTTESELFLVMFRGIVRFLDALARARKPLLSVSVNVMPDQVLDAWLGPAMVDDLLTFGLGPEVVKVEIVEAPRGFPGVDYVEGFARLKRHGFILSMDDFGTGHSTPERLLSNGECPFDEIKIDKSFVRGLADSSRHRKLVGGLISLAKGMGLRVVAEGIETEAQRRMLSDMGCDLGQGYLFGKPVPAATFAAIGCARTGT